MQKLFNQCPVCGGQLIITECKCPACQLANARRIPIGAIIHSLRRRTDFHQGFLTARVISPKWKEFLVFPIRQYGNKLDEINNALNRTNDVNEIRQKKLSNTLETNPTSNRRHSKRYFYSRWQTVDYHRQKPVQKLREVQE